MSPNSRRLSIILITVALSVSGVAQKWHKETYTEWSDKTARRVLGDSPWGWTYRTPSIGADFRTAPSVPREGSGSQIPSGREQGPTPGAEFQGPKSYFVSFASALPVRQAKARLAVLAGASEEQAMTYVYQEAFTQSIIVGVAVPPGQPALELLGAQLDDLTETTYLELKKSKRRLPLRNYLAPGAAGNPEALFFFDRFEDNREIVSVQEEAVRFRTRLTGGTRLDHRFKLKKMVYQGKLEI